MVGFTTRDTSGYAKIKITALLVSALGLTVLNFVIKDRYANVDDFGKIGLYQDVIAMFSGSVLGGEILARLIDDVKGILEVKYSQTDPLQSKPSIIKAMRITKNILTFLTPFGIGALLGTPLTPNSLPNYFAKFGVGALCGSQGFLAQREFENLNSQDHLNFQVNSAPSLQVAPTPPIDLENANASSGVLVTREKVKGFVGKYFPSIGFMAALVAFMSAAAATNTPAVRYVALALIVSTVTSFIVTDRVAANLQPQRATKDNRIRNEMFFRSVYFTLGFSTIFQYLTTLMDLESRNLDHDSNYLYALQVTAYLLLGLVIGGILANNLYPKMNFSSRITPPIAYQELTKTLVGSLEA